MAENFKLRWLFYWLVLNILLFIIALRLGDLFHWQTPFVVECLAIISYIVPVVWLLLKYKGPKVYKKIDEHVSRKTKWINLVIMQIILILFSNGMIMISFWVLNHIGFFDIIINLRQTDLLLLDEDLTSTYRIISNCLAMTRLIIIGPIVEELIFRGILLHKFALKWNNRVAIIVSSGIFSIFHLNSITDVFIDVFVVSVVWSLLYIKSRRIIVPMIAHMVYNAIVTLIAWPSQEELPILTSEQVTSYLRYGGVLIVITIPVIIGFIYRNWPRKDDKFLYMETTD
jgi:membrane protease YdiL (CAAX protease family)